MIYTEDLPKGYSNNNLRYQEQDVAVAGQKLYFLKISALSENIGLLLKRIATIAKELFCCTPSKNCKKVRFVNEVRVRRFSKDEAPDDLHENSLVFKLKDMQDEKVDLTIAKPRRRRTQKDVERLLRKKIRDQRKLST